MYSVLNTFSEYTYFYYSHKKRKDYDYATDSYDHAFEYQKTLLHALIFFLLKSLKAFGVSLNKKAWNICLMLH